jgi:hypothetical protein
MKRNSSHLRGLVAAVVLSVLVLGVAAGFVAWALLPSPTQIWVISDPSQAQERSFSDRFHSFTSGLMAFRVTGTLSSEASLVTPLGILNLPAGPFDLIAFGQETWTTSATVGFLPGQQGKGTLRIEVAIGACPTWVRRPPPEAMPALYSGGWTAYYPGTKLKAWSGSFSHGAKSGEFRFWDRDGRLTKTERWD